MMTTNPTSNNLDIRLAAEIAENSCHLLESSMLKIEHCLSQLNEQQVWWRPDDATNSVGNLLLHLAGNLRQWAISGVGEVPDTRMRQSEFDARGGKPKQELLLLLRQTVTDASKVIRDVDANQWVEIRTIQGFGVSAAAAISHTCSHFVGHTHQIILLTRMQLGDKYVFHWTPDTDRKQVPI